MGFAERRWTPAFPGVTEVVGVLADLYVHSPVMPAKAGIHGLCRAPQPPRVRDWEPPAAARYYAAPSPAARCAPFVRVRGARVSFESTAEEPC